MTHAEQHAPKANIVIVDDTPSQLRLLSKMLQGGGYTVRPAINGMLGLSSIRLYPPDLVLLDLMLPDLSGHEICAQLKADPPASEAGAQTTASTNKSERAE